MDTYEIEDNGKVYRVKAASEEDAVQAFQKQKRIAVGDGGVLDDIMNPAKAFANDAADWMMLGKQDEILAGMEAPIDMLLKDLSFEDAYGLALNRSEVERQLMQAESPKASVAGKVAGAITGPATKVGADFVGKGATWIDRAVRSVLPGGVTGSIAGAEGETLGDRAEGAAWGAGAGALLAPVAQAGGEFIGSQLSKAFNWIRGQGKQMLPSVAAGSIDDPVTASVMQQPGSQQVSRADMENAARELWRRLEADGRDPKKIFAAIQAGKMDERTLASVGGENVKQMIDTAASLPGRAKEIVAGAQRAAEQGQNATVTNAANKSLGATGDFQATGDILESQMQAASPLYKQAFATSQPVNVAPVIAKIDAEIAKAKGGVKTALEKARQLLLNNAGAVDDTLEGLHNSKIALDDLYQSMGKDSSLGNISRSKVLGVIKDLLKEMDASNPAYATARDAFAGPAAVQDAMDLGRNILKDDWIGNASEIAKMTTSEKRGLIEGAAQGWRDMVEGISNKADKAARLLNYEKFLNRIKAAFPSPAAFDQFKDALASQSREFSAVQMAGKGSQTLPRLADASADLESIMGTGVDVSRAGGGDLTTIVRGIKALMGRMGAAGEGERAAQAALALTPGKQALPYLSAINQKADPRALGLLMMSSSSLPASQARGLLGPR